MMHHFLASQRDELIRRCQAKVGERPGRAAPQAQLLDGVPVFLAQLHRTLAAEAGNDQGTSVQISGPASGEAATPCEMGASAAAHGRQLLELGFTVDEVVHDYGDLCKAITDLAFEQEEEFAIDELRTLHRCLDNAIADAVTEFGSRRDAALARQQESELLERAGGLLHGVRNSLSRASLAIGAMELGNLPMGGATGAVLKRSVASVQKLVESATDDLGSKPGATESREVFSLALFVADAASEAAALARTGGGALRATPIDPLLALSANRERMLAALASLLDNAFKFSLPRSEVSLKVHAAGHRILIDVEDQCGGLPHGDIERMFSPFTQRSGDRAGPGLGLAAARQSIEADGGLLSVRDVPGTGCVFTISLPRATVAGRA